MILPTQSSFCDAPKSPTLLLLAHAHVYQQVLYPLFFHSMYCRNGGLCPFFIAPTSGGKHVARKRTPVCSFTAHHFTTISLSAIPPSAIPPSTLPSDPKLHESRDNVIFSYCIPSGQNTEVFKHYEIRHVEIREGSEFRELKARKPESCHTCCATISTDPVHCASSGTAKHQPKPWGKKAFWMRGAKNRM